MFINREALIDTEVKIEAEVFIDTENHWSFVKGEFPIYSTFPPAITTAWTSPVSLMMSVTSKDLRSLSESFQIYTCRTFVFGKCHKTLTAVFYSERRRRSVHKSFKWLIWTTKVRRGLNKVSSQMCSRGTRYTQKKCSIRAHIMEGFGTKA